MPRLLTLLLYWKTLAKAVAISLTDYKVRVLDTGQGTGAVTRVLLESTNGQETWSTMGVSENIIEASWQALADSIVYGLLHQPS